MESAKLIGIQNERAVTKETDSEFLFAYQKWILLALKEQGVLNEAQYRCAEEKLKEQFGTFIPKEGGARN